MLTFTLKEPAVKYVKNNLLMYFSDLFYIAVTSFFLTLNKFRTFCMVVVANFKHILVLNPPVPILNEGKKLN